MNRKSALSIGYFVAALALLVLFQPWLVSRYVTVVSYSQAVRMAQDGQVASVVLTEMHIRGTFRQAQDGKTEFVAARVEPDAAEVFE